MKDRLHFIDTIYTMCSEQFIVTSIYSAYCSISAVQKIRSILKPDPLITKFISHCNHHQSILDIFLLFIMSNSVLPPLTFGVSPTVQSLQRASLQQSTYLSRWDFIVQPTSIATRWRSSKRRPSAHNQDGLSSLMNTINLSLKRNGWAWICEENCSMVCDVWSWTSTQFWNLTFLAHSGHHTRTKTMIWIETPTRVLKHLQIILFHPKRVKLDLKSPQEIARTGTKMRSLSGLKTHILRVRRQTLPTATLFFNRTLLGQGSTKIEPPRKEEGAGISSTRIRKGVEDPNDQRLTTQEHLCKSLSCTFCIPHFIFSFP